MNAKQRRALKRAPLQPDAREVPSELTRITRSFSIKVNLGRFSEELKYESADIFCSQSVEHLREDEVPASMAVYAFCKKQVMDDRKALVAEMVERFAPKGKK